MLSSLVYFSSLVVYIIFLSVTAHGLLIVSSLPKMFLITWRSADQHLLQDL